MVQLSATRCSCVAILWVSLVSFTAITLYVASQWVFIVVSVYFVIDSVRKLFGYTLVVMYLKNTTTIIFVLKFCSLRPWSAHLSAELCSTLVHNRSLTKSSLSRKHRMKVPSCLPFHTEMLVKIMACDNSKISPYSICTCLHGVTIPKIRITTPFSMYGIIVLSWFWIVSRCPMFLHWCSLFLQWLLE
jgi:hypothetical protein